MRSRKEIEEELTNPNFVMKVPCEILLDIREILQTMHLEHLAEKAGLK